MENIELNKNKILGLILSGGLSRRMGSDKTFKKISGINRNESGWNSAYVAGKIIKKIGPILAINKNDFYDNHVVKKSD